MKILKEVIIRYQTEDGRTVKAYQQEEIIRCKDCTHWDGYYCHNKWWGNGYGNYPPPIKSENGHCDWAERKEDGTDK